MSRTRSTLTLAAAITASLCAASAAMAQVARSGGSTGANSQMLQQMQQLASERTALQEENAKLKKSADDLAKQLDALKKAQGSVDQHAKESAAALAQAKTQREADAEQLQQTKARFDQLVAKFRETAQTLRDTESDRTQVKQTLAARDHELQVCIDRNVELYKINGEALTRLEKQNFWSRAAASEPFTKLKRVQMENLVDDYKARASDQKVTPPAVPGSASDAAPPYN